MLIVRIIVGRQQRTWWFSTNEISDIYIRLSLIAARDITYTTMVF
jgi:hypothetical protein